MSKDRDGGSKESSVGSVAERHNSGRWRDVWKRITVLGFGGGLALLLLGAVVSSAGLASFGLLGGIGVGAAGMIGQGLTKK